MVSCNCLDDCFHLLLLPFSFPSSLQTAKSFLLFPCQAIKCLRRRIVNLPRLSLLTIKLIFGVGHLLRDSEGRTCGRLGNVGAYFLGKFLRQLRLDNQQAFHTAMAEATGMAAFK